jgi:hypothetical protein
LKAQWCHSLNRDIPQAESLFDNRMLPMNFYQFFLL